MSMTDTINNIVEDVSAEDKEALEASVTSVNSEEVGEEEVLESIESEVSEETEEEIEVIEAKVKEEDDEDEEVEESAPALPSIPKTKAGVINAAVEMLKKARKHEAQQLFAKMVKMTEAEDDGTVKKAIKKAPNSVDPKTESADWNEDLDLIVANEATLSDGFREKAGAIFEAAYSTKVSSEIDRLESEYAQNLETEVSDVQTEIVEKVDSYLNYVIENWMKENEVAVQQDNIRLHEGTQQLQRADIVRKQSSGLAATDAEKLAGLVEDIDFEDADTFSTKVKTIRESYFTNTDNGPVDEADAIAGEDTDPESGNMSNSMNAYTNAISNHNQ